MTAPRLVEVLPDAAVVARRAAEYFTQRADVAVRRDGRFTVAEIGPGFKNTQFGGEGRLDTPRQNGAYYENQLQQALASGRKIWAIETWNEQGEGSGIYETQEYGRQYIDLTRKYVDRFKGRS